MKEQLNVQNHDRLSGTLNARPFAKRWVVLMQKGRLRETITSQFSILRR